MDENEWLADRFEEHRAHLRGVAYRMLGSLSEADDAVQDTWLRLSRSGADEIENLGGWLTTVVARVCLNILRSRHVRREEPLEVHVPDPVISAGWDVHPEEEAVLADSIGLALLVVLDTLAPAERLTFVLHDLFQLPFDEIAPMVGRTPAAARQLASRARRRVKGAELPAPDADLAHQREVVNAFFAAARSGNFDALVAVLDPDVVLRIDGGPTLPAASMVVHGAAAVARQARSGLRSWLSRPATHLRSALMNGAAGVVVTVDGQPVNAMGFTIADGKIVEIDAIADPEHVRRIAGTISSPTSSGRPHWNANMIRLIAAIDTERGIANDSGIPWNLPGDSAHFRAKTRTGLIVMGRATYDELAAPLHGRDNFVLTTQPGSLRAGFRSVAGLDQLSTDHPGEDIWVIGGAAVYAETINDASELLITQVLADFNCTKFFPAYSAQYFVLATQSEDHEDGGIKYRFETWRHL